MVAGPTAAHPRMRHARWACAITNHTGNDVQGNLGRLQLRFGWQLSGRRQLPGKYLTSPCGVGVFVSLLHVQCVLSVAMMHMAD